MAFIKGNYGIIEKATTITNTLGIIRFSYFDLLSKSTGKYSYDDSDANEQSQSVSFGNALFKGNVGIGTTSPGAYKLYVNDTSSNAFAINSTSVPVQRFLLNNVDLWGFLANYGSTNGFSIYNYVNPGIAFHINTAGNIGIGTTAPTSLLSVNGTADKVGGGSWGTFSDKRLKKNINEFTLGLDAIKSLKTVMYEYNGLKYKDDGKTYV